MADVFTVTLPDIGEGVVEGEVIEWLKNVNDPVDKDEAVVVVMTDKATVELPAPHPGILTTQYYAAGQIAIKDEPLYDITVAEGVVLPKAPSKAASKQKEARQSFKKKTLADATVDSTIPRRAPGSKALATPPVRRLARELGIDINAVEGSGAGGRVTAADLRCITSQPQGQTRSTRAAPQILSSTPVLSLEGDEEIPLIGIRKLTSEKMVEAKLIAPHFTYFDSVDARQLVQLRSNLKERAASEGIKLTYMPFFIKALSLALVDYPNVNGSIDLQKNALVVHKRHNVGIAMTGPNGLVVAVMKDVQEMSIEDVIRTFDALKKRALAAELDSADMKESTITISNFGTLGGGGIFATPIINYPELAILGLAKIGKQAIVVKDEVVAREILNVSWSFDHRVIDGDAAAAFSAAFCGLIKSPSRLL